MKKKTEEKDGELKPKWVCDLLIYQGKAGGMRVDRLRYRSFAEDIIPPQVTRAEPHSKGWRDE